MFWKCNTFTTINYIKDAVCFCLMFLKQTTFKVFCQMCIRITKHTECSGQCQPIDQSNNSCQLAHNPVLSLSSKGLNDGQWFIPKYVLFLQMYGLTGASGLHVVRHVVQACALDSESAMVHIVKEGIKMQKCVQIRLVLVSSIYGTGHGFVSPIKFKRVHLN